MFHNRYTLQKDGWRERTFFIDIMPSKYGKGYDIKINDALININVTKEYANAEIDTLIPSGLETRFYSLNKRIIYRVTWYL